MKDNVCCRFSHQAYNWKLKHVNSSHNACETFNWKSDVLCFFKKKTWRVRYDFGNVFFPIAKLTLCKTYKSNSDAVWNFSFQNHAFKKAPKMRNVSLSRSKMNQNVIFWMETLFQKMTYPKFFNSKSNALYFFESKIWRFVKLFKSKSDAFWNFDFKIMLFRKAPKIQSKSFSRSKLNHNVIFWMQTIF